MRGGREAVKTYTARAQMFLVAVLARWTVANALPWVRVSVTWAGR